MKQSLAQQFAHAHELEYNDAYVRFLYSRKSNRLIEAYQRISNGKRRR